MNAALLRHLWRSSEVRTALKKEVWHLFLFVVLYLGTAVVSRYIREKPMLEGILAAAIGGVAVILMWLVSAIRTLRGVLREHDLLVR